MIGGATGRPVAKSTGPGKPTTTPQTGTSGVLRQHVVEHRHHLSMRLRRPAGDVPGAVRVLQDVAVERGDADPDVQGAEGADDDASLLGAEAERPGRAAAGRGAELAVGEEAHLDGLIHALA